MKSIKNRTLNNLFISIFSMIAVVMFTVCTSFTYSVISHAQDAENAEAVKIQGELATLNENADARETADASSKVVESFKAGDPIYITERLDGWLEIYYQGEKLYIKDDSGNIASVNDTSDISSEMEKQAQTDKAWIESYESQLKAERNARIWRVIIGVIIVGLVAYIVYKTIQQNKTGEKTEKKKKDRK